LPGNVSKGKYCKLVGALKGRNETVIQNEITLPYAGLFF